MATEPGAGLEIDDLGTAGGELLHRRPDVADGEAYVVHAGTPGGEKPSDVRVGTEELDSARAEAQVDGLDTLLLERVAKLDLRAKERPVRLHRRVEVLDGEGDVVHGAHVHTTDPSDWPLACGESYSTSSSRGLGR